MSYENYFGIGVAGNFTGHLEQANEAKDFEEIKVSDANQPKAIFPFYMPKLEGSFLSIYPLSSNSIALPTEAFDVQIEPEVALICDVKYVDGKVSVLKPTHFSAYNDCSIRRADAKKISHKKNWGSNTKGISSDLIAIDSYDSKGILENFSIASFHESDNKIHQYGETSEVASYSYKNEQLLDWIIDRLNHQEDIGPAENLSKYLSESDFPQKCIISIGATRYTSYGESNFLKKGDKSIVAVFDHRVLTIDDVLQSIQSRDYDKTQLSLLIQNII
ncbi:DUF5718 family protein [Halobacteriovorax sp. HLS]|uniref:DUF5718 family protein n=1 Tax=Halobacteriovorax sp. HLS TaxID=2234000 RepID=UPI000FD73834|nr:DUF5718 family protein [Halobacteriovorax sp. HLS]